MTTTQNTETITYSVLYSVNGVYNAMQVIVGPTGGKAYTTEADIPRIIATKLGLDTDQVSVIRKQDYRDFVESHCTPSGC